MPVPNDCPLARSYRASPLPQIVITDKQPAPFGHHFVDVEMVQKIFASADKKGM